MKTIKRTKKKRCTKCGDKIFWGKTTDGRVLGVCLCNDLHYFDIVTRKTSTVAPYKLIHYGF